ncbi:MAG: MarR family transcriptional regulator, partial [bacterium]|nr:MarR family transcriptional regulator [bacterium]
LRGRNGVRVQDLAKSLDVESPFVTRLGNKLANKKLLNSKFDPKDKRARLVRLTSKGDKLVSFAELSLRGSMKVYLQSVDSKSFDTFLRIMAQLSELPTANVKHYADEVILSKIL